MKKWIGIVLILFILPLGGCVQQVSKEELENFGLIEVMAYDLSKTERAKITVAYPETLPTGETKTQTYCADVDLTHEVLKKISRKSDKSMHFGQLRVILFSEDFARQNGFEKIIKDLYQDPVISNNVSIAIVKGQAGDYLTDENSKRPLISIFLSELLMSQRAKVFNAYSTLHDIVYHLTNEISDPLLPYVEKKGKDIEITGAAVFRKDRMIDTITAWESNLVNALSHRKKITGIKMQVKEVGGDGTNYIVLEFVKSKVKIKGNKDSQSPRLNIKLNLIAQIYGYIENANLENPDIVKKLEKEASKTVENQITDLLTKLREMQVDPAQLGEAFRMHHKGQWSKQIWNDIYPETEFDVEVKIEITKSDFLR